jgi:hypothetical protein
VLVEFRSSGKMKMNGTPQGKAAVLQNKELPV